MRIVSAAIVVLLVSAGCGGAGDPQPVDLSVAHRTEVGYTEDAYAGAGGVAIDGDTVWATKPNEGELIRIDATSGKVVGRKHVCNGANDVAVGAGAVFVACESGEEVIRLDRAGEETGRAKVGVKALGLAATGDALWVSNREFDGLVRVDPRTMKVVARIDSGLVRSGAWDVAATPDAVWFTTQALSVVRVDPETNEIAATIPTVTDDVALSLGWIAADADGVWMTSGSSLARIDPGTNEFTDDMELGIEGALSHVQALGGRVWVSGASEALLVDAGHRAVVGRVAVASYTGGAGLRGIAAEPNGAWVLDATDGDVVGVAADPANG